MPVTKTYTVIVHLEGREEAIKGPATTDQQAAQRDLAVITEAQLRGTVHYSRQVDKARREAKAAVVDARAAGDRRTRGVSGCSRSARSRKRSTVSMLAPNLNNEHKGLLRLEHTGPRRQQPGRGWPQYALDSGLSKAAEVLRQVVP
jgi:hypothetical protein